MPDASTNLPLTHQAKGPVLLLPRFVERIWGSASLEPYFAAQPDQTGPIGEVWLTATDCQVSGSSQTLGDLAAAEPAAFGCEVPGEFPLLLKLLFPTDKLSVQVHPNNAEAQATLGQPRGKTECWYVLSADAGAEVAVGFREPLSPAAMQQAIADGSIEQHLRKLPVRAGDMIFVDAGTVHAIGPGMVLLETQQYSDVTYRLWDYGRPRELHIEAGLAVTRSKGPRHARQSFPTSSMLPGGEEHHEGDERNAGKRRECIPAATPGIHQSGRTREPGKMCHESRPGTPPAATEAGLGGWDDPTLRSVCRDWSGRRDSNPRPSAPKADALPGCATPRLP